MSRLANAASAANRPAKIQRAACRLGNDLGPSAIPSHQQQSGTASPAECVEPPASASASFAAGPFTQAAGCSVGSGTQRGAAGTPVPEQQPLQETVGLDAAGNSAWQQLAVTSPVAAQQLLQDPIAEPQPVHAATDGAGAQQSGASGPVVAAGELRQAQAKPAASPGLVRVVRRQGSATQRDAAELSSGQGPPPLQGKLVPPSPTRTPMERPAAQLQPSQSDGEAAPAGLSDAAAKDPGAPLAVSPPSLPGLAESRTRNHTRLFLPDPALLNCGRSPGSPTAAAAAVASEAATTSAAMPKASCPRDLLPQQGPEPANSPVASASQSVPQLARGAADDAPPDVTPPSTGASQATLAQPAGIRPPQQQAAASKNPAPADARAGPPTHQLRFLVPVVHGLDMEIHPVLARRALSDVAAVAAEAGHLPQSLAVPLLLVRDVGRPSQQYWPAALKSERRHDAAAAIDETRWYIPAADWYRQLVQSASDLEAFPGGNGQLVIHIW